MFLMAVAAACTSACTILCSLVQLWHIPYYRLAGTAELLLAAGLLITIYRRGEFAEVQSHQWKWIWLRGAFGSGTALLGWIAVAVGAPVGDASALGSVNVVVAALLGRVFLGEPLRCLHILALLSSVVGAIVVSRPDSDSQLVQASSAWLGYLFALASGISSGGLFIASRKSQDISSTIMSFSVSLQEGLCLLIVARAGLVEDGPLEALLASPLVGMVWLTAFVLIFVVTIGSLSVGAQLCPALASSAIYTSMSMSLGYIAQTLIHRQHLKPAKVAGAALMLLAVALIAVARWLQSKEVSARELQDPLLSGATTSEGDVLGDEAAAIGSKHTDSLATFIAAEFSGLSNSKKPSVRQRRTAVAVGQGLGPVLA